MSLAYKAFQRIGAGAVVALLPALALAQDHGAVLDRGDTAWILTSTALVLFMTLPGLALFYGGLVRSKNVLSVMAQCVGIACLASVLWLACGYSLAFSGSGALIGDFHKAFLHIGRGQLHGTIPESAFFMFQGAFAVITPALIVGAYAERIRFPAVLLFSGLWLLTVYAPVAHWVWGGGWLMQRGVMDYAGGLVVHATAGISALLAAIAVGRREGFPRDLHPPHSPGLTMIGAGMLWVGWYGFNGGSALAANGDAAMALVVTHLSASAAGLTWALIEWKKFGRPSMVGLVTGVVGGLATVTPASGYVGPVGGLVLGVCGSAVCFWAVEIVKHRWKVDDSLDVFAVHGVGGILGSLLVAVLAHPALDGVGYGAAHTMAGQAMIQVIGVVSVLGWSAVMTAVILFLVKKTTGLRAREDEIEEGLDLAHHGERSFSI
jgi:Amt family ammonium transporter